MNPHSLRTLAFDRIRDLLAERATFSLGRQLCQELEPTPAAAEVEARQEETGQARGLLEAGGGEPPLSGLHDVREVAGRAARGGSLIPPELLGIADTLEAAARLKRFLEVREDRAPLLAALADFEPLPHLARSIRAAVAEPGVVVDEASPVLARVRRRIRSTQERVRRELDSLLRSADGQRYLQEPLVTIRANRYVVPVRQEFRQHVPGIVHDQSASGATLFVEPLRVLELNNELRSLEREERDEVDRILAELSAAVGAAAEDVTRLVTACGRLDHVVARARLACDLRAVRPELDRTGRLVLRGARHPLLRPPTGEVVPLDLELGGDCPILVITGPNTGGKTVVLKTVGVMALMHQAGLQIPAAASSRLPVYPGIHCDIGDEQSIEQNLSTFSGHLRNILSILNEALPGSLVLLDELGAGTDPGEGSVLAMAILERLEAMRVHALATTHYGELKLFAHERPGMANAAMEFDPDDLRPTFRLAIGVPGRSNALEIAARLGLDAGLVARAREFLSRDAVAMDDLLRQVERERAALAEERLRMETATRDAREWERRLEQHLAETRARDREVGERARRDLREILARGRAQVELLLKELKDARKTAIRGGPGVRESALAARRALEGLEAELEGAIGPGAAAEPPAVEPVSADELRVGATVTVRSLACEGIVLALGDPVAVQVGAMRVSVPLSDLGRATRGGEPVSERYDTPMLAKAAAVSPEFHLRGLVVEDALMQLDKYLDDACLAGLDRVRLVHGKGTGALREAVRAYLRQHPRVVSYRPGESGEGGDGVTVAELLR
ncbi:MAG TPA: endonuclease MutS2 [Bacillota bacterium]|nr:endonuclease MutS2 [Bacillota bacterium]